MHLAYLSEISGKETMGKKERESFFSLISMPPKPLFWLGITTLVLRARPWTFPGLAQAPTEQVDWCLWDAHDSHTHFHTCPQPLLPVCPRSKKRAGGFLASHRRREETQSCLHGNVTLPRSFLLWNCLWWAFLLFSHLSQSNYWINFQF